MTRALICLMLFGFSSANYEKDDLIFPELLNKNTNVSEDSIHSLINSYSRYYNLTKAYNTSRGLGIFNSFPSYQQYDSTTKPPNSDSRDFFKCQYAVILKPLIELKPFELDENVDFVWASIQLLMGLFTLFSQFISLTYIFFSYSRNLKKDRINSNQNLLKNLAGLLMHASISGIIYALIWLISDLLLMSTFRKIQAEEIEEQENSCSWWKYCKISRNLLEATSTHFWLLQISCLIYSTNSRKFQLKNITSCRQMALFGHFVPCTLTVALHLCLLMLDYLSNSSETQYNVVGQMPNDCLQTLHTTIAGMVLKSFAILIPNISLLGVIIFYSCNNKTTTNNCSECFLVLGISIVLLSIVSGFGQIIISLLTYAFYLQSAWLTTWLARGYMTLGLFCVAFMPLVLIFRNNLFSGLPVATSRTKIEDKTWHGETDESKDNLLRLPKPPERQTSNHTYESIKSTPLSPEMFINGPEAFCFTPISLSNILVDSSFFSSHSDLDTIMTSNSSNEMHQTCPIIITLNGSNPDPPNLCFMGERTS